MLDPVFNPIWLYLQNHEQAEAAKIVTYLIYMGNKDGQYYYKNKITRSFIVVNEEGGFVSGTRAALHSLAVYKTLVPERKKRKPRTG